MLQQQHLLLGVDVLKLGIKKTVIGKIKSLAQSQRNFFCLQSTIT